MADFTAGEDTEVTVNKKIPAFMLAGTNSGCGKTTVTLAILRAMERKGIVPAPFKCGPDYIDPQLHRMACKEVSINLDGFFMDKAALRKTFFTHCVGADAAVVEGAMGLFDGDMNFGGALAPAGIAQALDLPVILVVNVHGIGQSVAPLVSGFVNWNKNVRIAGVFAAMAGSENHVEILRQSLSNNGLPPLIGYMIRNDKLKLKERHLGLSLDDYDEDFFDLLADNLKLDWEKLEKFTQVVIPDGFTDVKSDCPTPEYRLGVAVDEAFSFYYPENFEKLHRAGIEIVAFSPIHDRKLPENLDGLYFGGGYPELYAVELAANSTMIQDIRDFAADNKVIYGECGGYVYLTQAFVSSDGTAYEFCNLLPGRAFLKNKLAALGYRNIKILQDCPLGKKNSSLKGHEFHYSVVFGNDTDNPLFESVSLNGRKELCGSRNGNVFGSYLHIFFPDAPGLLTPQSTFLSPK